MAYLSSEQALADAAELIFALKNELGAQSSAVIGFGGSYGGMLAAWLRLKYPWAVDGVIAASAPIWAFQGQPMPDVGGFASLVTLNAGLAAGGASAASPECVPNLQAGWAALRGTPQEGWDALTAVLRLCDDSAVRSVAQLEALANWLQGAWAYLAMGNFPYASDYLTNGGGVLPAWPVREACSHLSMPVMSGTALLAGLRDAAAVFYNVSGDQACFSTAGSANNETAQDGLFWSFQACTEMVMPMNTSGAPRDAFWAAPWDDDAVADDCAARWGVRPRPLAATVAYGGRELRAASNIVFSNGQLDPWSYAGVTTSLGVASLVPLTVAAGAHHLDLMFSHPLDPQSVRDVRARERAEIRRWVDEAASKQPPLRGACPTAPSAGAAEELKRWIAPLILLFLMGAATGGAAGVLFVMRARARDDKLRAAAETGAQVEDDDEDFSLEQALILPTEPAAT